MIKVLRLALPVLTAAAGLWLGGWISGGAALETKPAPEAGKRADLGKATFRPEATAIGFQPTEEEAAREEEVWRLWQNGGQGPTLEALTAYARVNPARALDLAMTLQGDKAWELVMKLVQTLQVQAGGVAMDVLLRHPQYCKGCPALDTVFGLCARFDPERAWREANAPGVKFTTPALDAIARTCGETNPRKGMELAARLTGTKDQAQFTRTVLRGWAQGDAGALVAWLGTQEDASSFCQQVPWGKVRSKRRRTFWRW